MLPTALWFLRWIFIRENKKIGINQLSSFLSTFAVQSPKPLLFESLLCYFYHSEKLYFISFYSDQMGRSQVQYNRTHGRGRGKGGSKRDKNTSASSSSSSSSHNTSSNGGNKTNSDSLEDNSWRFNRTSNNAQDDTEYNDIQTAHLLSKHDYAINASHYSQYSRQEDQNDPSVVNENILSNYEYEDYMKTFQSPHFEKTFLSLAPSVRLLLPSKIGERWDNIAMRGNLDAPKTMTELKLECRIVLQEDDSKKTEVEEEGDHLETYIEKVKIEETTEPTLNKSPLEEQSNKTENDNDDNQSIVEMQEKELSSDGSEDEEEDLDAWLDSVIS